MLDDVLKYQKCRYGSREESYRLGYAEVYGNIKCNWSLADDQISRQ